ncbi:MAG TPA: hypothetical protein VGG27_03960 [Magnetospirillaceae bacterium]|jgi:hypothetical protein
MIKFYDWLRGSGVYAVTVPPMDGALKPNDLLETASIATVAAQPDNLTPDGSRVLFSTGNTLMSLERMGEKWSAQSIASFAAAITCIGAEGRGGIAIGIDDGTVLLKGGKHDGLRIDKVADRPLVCPTACAFAGENTLILCLGSLTNPASRWKADLMERNETGSVWSIDLASGAATRLADRLAFPYGLQIAGPGRIVVTESWKHRVVEIVGGKVKELLADLPGYPARLARSGDGYWLSAFAPRSQMVEFVLRERKFCLGMMANIDAEYWMAPALISGRNHLEPLQGGAIRHLGVLKPWSPTRSYGLLVELDAAFKPLRSLHSRAGGRHHGITSGIEFDGAILATSKGGDAVLALPRQS